MGQLQQLELLQKLNEYTFNPFTTFDYKQFSNVTNAIIYLDPPYESTSKHYYKNEMDYKYFYDWAVDMSHKNIVLISSYALIDNRFEEVYNFEKAKSTFQGGKRNGRTEKLFMVKITKSP